MLVYIFCGIFGSSYVVNFVVIVLLLTLDFWTVSQGATLAILTFLHMMTHALFILDQEHFWSSFGWIEVVE